MDSITEVLNSLTDYEEISGADSDWIPLVSRRKLSVVHIMGICASMLAFQIAYSVEFAIGTPIMRRLGLSQAESSAMWVSGPLSGFVVQLIVGYYSDILRSKLGRRRPYILFGGIGILIGFLAIYHVEFLGQVMNPKNSKKATKYVLAISLFFTNIAINVVQGPSRALIGDVVPQVQQVFANTVGASMIGIAGIVANFVGGVQFSKRINLGFSNEQIVIISGSFLIFIGLVVTLIVAKEEPLTEAPARERIIKEITLAAKNTPSPVYRVALVYFFSWMACFPFQVSITDFFAQDIYGGSPTNTYDEKYINGVSYGMLVVSISNVIVVLYSLFQGYTIEKLGMKLTFAISQIIATLCLFPLYFLSNKYTLMMVLAPLGFAFAVFNSIPFAIVGLTVPQEQMGVYMGLINSFAVIGQQLSNILLENVVASFSSKKGPVIASGFVFSIIASIMCSKMEIPCNDVLHMESILQTSSVDPIK